MNLLYGFYILYPILQEFENDLSKMKDFNILILGTGNNMPINSIIPFFTMSEELNTLKSEN